MLSRVRCAARISPVRVSTSNASAANNAIANPTRSQAKLQPAPARADALRAIVPRTLLAGDRALDEIQKRSSSLLRSYIKVHSIGVHASGTHKHVNQARKH